MSQVKNLRAMFENKGDTSPPDRGRSPGVSTSTSNPAGSNGTGSPRPLSKVRTNFVAIEKDGRMGLRRDHSGESSLSRRRLSTETDAESTSTFPDRPVMASLDDLTKPMRKLFISEPIPESPRQHLDASRPFHDEEKPSAALAPSDPTTKTSSEGAGAKKTTPASSKGGRKGDKNQASASAAQPRATVPPPKKSAATGTNAAKPPAKPTTKAPAATKLSTEAPKRADAKSTVKVSEKPAPKRETATTAKAITAAAKSRPMSSTMTNRPQPLRTAGHADTGFTKPKPKSPTKPVNLPSSLIAPTASSASKGGAPRQSLSRQSGSLQNPSAPAHSSSRERLSTASPSAQLVKRQGSVMGRPRPSVGPPPSKASQPDTGACKQQSHVDEGFLARMMRPTQSSSSKTADKNPLTPPKTALRPSTSATDHSLRQETSARKPAGLQIVEAKKPRAPSSQELEVAQSPENNMNEAVNTETAESPAGSVQGSGEVQTTMVPRNPGPAPEPEQADKVAHETAQFEAAEEVATAHEADLVQSPVVPRDPVPAPGPAPVEDAAPETARVETAEEAVSLVEETDLVETTAKPDITTPHFDPTPTDEPAPEVEHTEVAEGENEFPYEDIGHSHAPPEELALELDTPEPARNTEGDVGDAAHEVAEQPFAESADGASESAPAVADEDRKDEPVLLHDTATGAEAVHGAEGLGHGPLSGSEQEVKAAVDDDLTAQ
ncbi:Uncharacterized protein TCAP_05169 [Tolypocladium capitatum]|uniref:Uncharacterized protein n=1 Tax=Tolypocladium capitatum TaxID=45235 RepID=A0A2K3QBI9_9HYPO|nr:Uncharacterized protein TCAP_05169 [Tolypocladium capitatum]